MTKRSSNKIVFVNRFFHPDISATSQMVSDLAFELASGGQRVGVITSRLRYDDPSALLPAFETVKGVAIHRVWTSRFGRGSLAGRLFDYLTFYLSAPLKLFFIASRCDVVVAKTDPPLISVPVLWVASLKRARLVNWLQDLFPEVATSLGLNLGGALPRALLRTLRNASLRMARANVVLGTRMADRVTHEAHSAAVRIIPNWSPNSEVSPLARETNTLAVQWQMADRFIVGYSGNLGRAHELGILLEAAGRLRHRQEIVFLVIGEGNQKTALQEEVARRGLANVLFKPYQPQELLKYSLTLPDVHLVSLKPELEGLIVPSKFYGALAAGRAVIFIGDSDGEVARDIKRGDCGICVAPDDAEALANAVEQLFTDRARCERLGAQARALFDREFARPLAMQRWKAVLAEAAQG